MVKAFLSKLSMALYFIVGSVVLELVCFHVLNFGFFPEYWMYDIAIICFIAMLIFTIPNYIAQYVIFTILLVVQAVLVYTNYTLYFIYGGELFTFEMFKLIKEAAVASNTTFFNFVLAFQLVFIVLALATVGFILLRLSNKHKMSFKRHFAMLLILVFSSIQLVSLGTVFGYRQNINAAAENDHYTTSDAFLMNTNFLKESSYRKFGTFGFYVNLMLSDYPVNRDEMQKAAIKYFNSGKIYGQDESSNVFGVDKGNNVIVIMMESLEWFAFGDGTYDPELNNLSCELTPNMYSLIKGRNGVSNSTTANLPGLTANNFYAKSKTNISEAYGLLGNHPIGSNLEDIAGSGDNSLADYFGYSLPNVLSSLGYNTTYAHSHDLGFYSRSSTHKNLGFDKLVGKNTIKYTEGEHAGEYKYTGDNIKFYHWMPEEEFVKETIGDIVPDSVIDGEKFFTYYLNVSTHGDYKDSSSNADQVRYKYFVMYGEDDCELDENGNYVFKVDVDESSATPTQFYENVLANYDDATANSFVNYMSAVCGFDAGLGVILDKLEEYHIYDDTTILLYSDHYAYYDSLSYNVKGFRSDDVSKVMEVNTIPFIISSPGLKTVNNGYVYTSTDMFCSAYDVVPTIFDLLGIKFNQNFYAGGSLFKTYSYYNVEIKNEESKAPLKVYYSNVGGIYSQYVYSYNLVNFSLINPTIKIKDDEIKLIKQEADNTLSRLYYLSILNEDGLFVNSKLTNKQFVQT